jgi:hypothetical protein
VDQRYEQVFAFSRKLGEGTRESIVMMGNAVRDFIYGAIWLLISLLLTFFMLTAALVCIAIWSIQKYWIAWLFLTILILGITLSNRAHAEVEDRGPMCMALAVYSEGRGEDAIGQAAIAQVVLNRLKLLPFGSDACDVVLAPGQFIGVDSWTMPRHPNDNSSWLFARFIAAVVSTGEASVPPPIGRALFFKRRRPDGSHDAQWMGQSYVGTVGEHDFFGPR